MRRSLKTPSAEAGHLRDVQKKLVKRGHESSFLDLRLEYQEASQVLTHYLPHFISNERVYPNLLPTQASGRWSVTEPPMVTIPHPLQEEVVLPDDGWPWVCFDWNAIEARITACYSDDKEDLDAFNKGYDIHTITSCKMLGDPLPPNLVNPHTSPECEEWRKARGWAGKDDKRRGLAKCRYCVLYGRDHTAVIDSAYAKEWVKQGGNREELVEAARLFLRSKPGLVACKKKWWAECARTSEARTALGRRRRLFGDAWTRSKEGWNHMVQGLVVDMLNLAIISVTRELPESYLVYPSHDAAKFAVRDRWLREAISVIRHIVEKEWTINNNTFTSTANWYVRWPDGSKEDI